MLISYSSATTPVPVQVWHLPLPQHSSHPGRSPFRIGRTVLSKSPPSPVPWHT